MKFLMIVLAIHLVGELIGNRKKDKNAVEASAEDNHNVRHPAEFELR